MSSELLINKSKTLEELFLCSSHMELGLMLPILKDIVFDEKLESITQRLNDFSSLIPAKELSEAILNSFRDITSEARDASEQYKLILLEALQSLNVDGSKEEAVFDLEIKLLVFFYGEKLEQHPIFKRKKNEKVSFFGSVELEVPSFESIFPVSQSSNPLSTIQWLIQNENINKIYEGTNSDSLIERAIKASPLNLFKKKSKPSLNKKLLTLLLKIAIMRQIQVAFEFQRFNYELRSCI